MGALSALPRLSSSEGPPRGSRLVGNKGVALRRFLDIIWVGILAAIVAMVVANLLRLLGMAAFDVPADFDPLEFRAVTVTAGGAALLAALVFAALTAWERLRGVQVFFWIGLVALVVSLAGPLLLAPNDYPGLGSGPVITLILIHVGVAVPAICLPIILNRSAMIRE